MKKENIKIVMLTSVMFLSSWANSQTSEIYRYKDKSGNLIYTDKFPSNKKTEVGILSKKTGVLKNLSDLEATKEAQKLTDEERLVISKGKEKEEEQIKKDQFLLNTYSNTDELDRIKKYELDQIDRAIQNDINIVSALKEQRDQMDKDIKANPKNKDNVSSEYSKISESIDKTNINLNKNKEMYIEREKKYNGERARLVAVLEILAKKTAPPKEEN
ncbi:hypothetical protein GW796_07360 [archaeon]|nr:hypothetical protein [archaeon]NCQ51701.1 hypothetical protein [archaeon]